VDLSPRKWEKGPKEPGVIEVNKNAINP